MTEQATVLEPQTLHSERAPLMSATPWRALAWQLTLLALPIMGESVLNMLVGLTDVFLAGHLPSDSVPAVAAVGSVSYVLWLIGLIVSTIGAGSAAIISRATGARHRSLANSVAGQSVTAAIALGLVLALIGVVFARPLADLTGLKDQAHDFALYYIRILALSLPFSTLMFTAGACLRGAGDTLTPAIAMITVDGTNILFSGALARGWLGIAPLGFRGIAIGTVISYVIGGLLLLVILLHGGRRIDPIAGRASGRRGLKLHLHRMRPHWSTLRRVLRIGLPNGMEGILTWIAQFAIVVLINSADPGNVMSSAHIITIRIESLSFMGGYAIAAAAATMVGQSLGMKSPARASRCAYISFALAAALMCAWGSLFVTIPHLFAQTLSSDRHVIDLAARCLFIAGCSQFGFAAAMSFGGALRGAGDTLVVMIINLCSIIFVRFLSVLIVVHWFHMGLTAVWFILAAELSLRGILMYARFLQGGWKRVEV